MRIRTHPGEVLREEYPKPLGMSARALAVATDGNGVIGMRSSGVAPVTVERIAAN